MNDREKRELLEIYKLHAELADRVSQRREGANRLYVSLLVAIFVFFGILLRFDSNSFPTSIVTQTVGIIGAFLSISWYIVIRSYRQLNAGKFDTLHEIEKHLVFSFFTREWQILMEGKSVNRYWKLTVVETILPILFFVLSIGIVIISFF